MIDYSSCRHCGGQVTLGTAQAAQRRKRQGLCSLRCVQRSILKEVGCCSKATVKQYIPVAITICPEHGERQ